MELPPRKPNEDSVPTDTLKILYLLTFGVMRLRFVKFILIVIFIFHSSVGIVQVTELLFTFDGQQFLQYGPFFLITCSCLVNISTVLSVEKLLSKIFIQLAMSRFRTLNRFPVGITDRILIESKLVTVAAIGTLSVLILYAMSHLRLFGDENLIYGVVLIKRNFDKVSNFFILLYFSTLPILAYVAFINGGVVIYTLMHLRFFIFMINNHLERTFADDVVIHDFSIVRDRKYQEMIFEKLKIIIDRHQSVKMIEKKLNDNLLPSFVLLLYLGVAAVISMLFNILVDNSKFGFFVAISSMVASSIMPLLVVIVGQILKNEYDRMYENTLNCPWLVWDTRNRKTLMFLMLNLQKSFFLGKSGLVLCEFSFIPRVLNFLWNVATFMVQVGYRNVPAHI